jgi:hypothetical protein
MAGKKNLEMQKRMKMLTEKELDSSEVACGISS